MAHIVAIQECSCGNSEVGSMWLETETFDVGLPISTITKWALEVPHASGRLIISIPTSVMKKHKESE